MAPSCEHDKKLIRENLLSSLVNQCRVSASGGWGGSEPWVGDSNQRNTRLSLPLPSRRLSASQPPIQDSPAFRGLGLNDITGRLRRSGSIIKKKNEQSLFQISLIFKIGSVHDLAWGRRRDGQKAGWSLLSVLGLAVGFKSRRWSRGGHLMQLSNAGSSTPAPLYLIYLSMSSLFIPCCQAKKPVFPLSRWRPLDWIRVRLLSGQSHR